MKNIALSWPNQWPSPCDGLRLQVKVNGNTVINTQLASDDVDYQVDWAADADYEVKIFARFEAEEYPTPKVVEFHTPADLTATGSGGLVANETSA